MGSSLTGSTIKYTGTGFFFRELKKVYFLYPELGEIYKKDPYIFKIRRKT